MIDAKNAELSAKDAELSAKDAEHRAAVDAKDNEIATLREQLATAGNSAPSREESQQLESVAEVGGASSPGRNRTVFATMSSAQRVGNFLVTSNAAQALAAAVPGQSHRMTLENTSGRVIRRGA